MLSIKNIVENSNRKSRNYLFTYSSPRFPKVFRGTGNTLGELPNWAIVMGIVRQLAARFKINVEGIKNRGDQRQ